MTTTIGSLITGQVIQRITATSGVNSGLAGAVTLPGGGSVNPLSAAQVVAQNVAPNIADQSNPTQYPAISVYCEKIVNNLAEKFRTFSGSVQVAIEVRHSQDQLSGLQGALETYADAVMQVLNANRGDWGNGMFYCGEYEAAFTPVKQGGKNFMQTAKITFEIGVSRS
jgi:hypothetical protein